MVAYNHLLFTGNAGSGKTNTLKEKLLESDYEFIICIDKHNEYHSEIQELRKKGFEVVSLDSNKEFQTQINIALEEEINKSKVIHICTNESKNGFDNKKAEELFSNIYEKTKKANNVEEMNKTKVMFYIDDFSSFINEIPDSMIAVCAVYDCFFVATSQNENNIRRKVLSQFYKENLPQPIK